jgi:hypothetical protein
MGEIEERAAEKRRLIVSTNNLGARTTSQSERQLPETTEEKRYSHSDVKSVVKYEPKPETFGSKFRKAMFGDMALRDIPQHLILNVAVPAIKQTFYDMFCNGLGIAFGMEQKRGGRRNGESGYSGYFRSSSSGRDSDDDLDDRMPSSYRDIYFYSEGDANEALETMYDYLKDQGYVTVLEYYGISGRKSPNSRRDDKLGWDKEDLRGLRPYKSRGKWWLDLPRPTHLDRL